MRAPKPIDHARVDREVGLRIKERRRALNLSQTWLGAQIGVSFQQVQKYENGKNRVSASALVAIADALSTSSANLLGGLGAHDAEVTPALAWALGPDGEIAYRALHRLTAPSFDAVINTARAIGALADARGA